ncbi:MAG TPA: ATP-binding protein, partial [Pyrinomonadaceae bacterium]
NYSPSDLGFAEDLAHRAALAVDNARLYRRMEEANRAKDEFLATLSHELRTPLTAILGWAMILRSAKPSPEDAAHALEVVERNAKMQKQIIDDLLDVSRIISGNLRLNVTQVELRTVVEAAVDAVSLSAKAKGIRIETEDEGSVGPIMGDADRLQQVVWNLLSNAVKFTPAGGRIQVRLAQDGAHSQIIVSDTGAGISPDFHPFLFDRFRQADSSSTRQHGGLGLGLAIVRHLVELHGGTVSAENRKDGEGAVFTVSIPTRSAGKDEAQEEERAEASATPDGNAHERRAELTGRRILVVDDDPDALALLGTILTRAGAEVVSASSASAALEVLERTSVDLIISDIGMPGEDGYELIRKVRALAARRGERIPAIALTAYAREEDRVRSLAEGFQAHIVKPSEPGELLRAVAALIVETNRV